MAAQTSVAETRYSPLYFLSSVGAGGLAVTFFIYLMFWVPHPGQPVPVFEDIASAFATGGAPLQFAIAVALAGIAWFAWKNLSGLVWNLRRLKQFRASEAGQAHANTNAATQLMAMPLALAMSINVAFILGLVFVPGLWSIVEYLFPLALIAFLAVGVLAFRQLGGFLGRVLSGGGGFDCKANNSFAQLLPAFTLSMIGVGLAAPGAMSATPTIAGISVVLSGFFLVASLTIAAIAMVLGIRSMMENGVALEAAPTLLIILPLVTVLSILLMRQWHGLHVHFDGHTNAADTLVFLSRMVSLQLVFALFGLTVLARIGYWKSFVFGQGTSAGSYALVCPGVAFSVLMHFWINKGLVAAGLIAKFGPAYWGFTAIAVAAQLVMIVLVIRLNKQNFGRSSSEMAGVAAE